MLYKRILTAIPLAAFVFWMVFFQPSSVFFYFVLFVAFISGYEWAKLSGIKNVVLKSIVASTVVAVTWVMHALFNSYVLSVIYVSALCWLGITFYLKFARPKEGNAALKLDKLLIAFVILPAAALAMQEIHALHVAGNWQGPAWLFYALSLVWVADIGAYFAGKKFGKNKLAPHISPGKTKEGLWGGVLATTIYTLMASYYFQLNTEAAILLVLLSVILTFISVSGDLYISFLKREAGVKDSGNILPGHGGILDRIDSALAALPVFVLGFNWIIFSAI